MSKGGAIMAARQTHGHLYNAFHAAAHPNAQRMAPKLLIGIAALLTAEMETFAQFEKENLTWREPCEIALSCKVEIATSEHERTLKVAREYLINFPDQIESDPNVKLAKEALASAESLQSRFDDAEDLKAWQIGISGLTE